MRRTLKVGAAVLLSLIILAVVVHFVGFAATIEAVRRAGFGAFAAVGALTVLHLILQAVAWMRLNQGIGHRVRFSTLFAAITTGMAVNILTPSSYLGGEPVKVIYVGKRTGLPYHEVAGTVVLSKYLEALSFLLVFGACTSVSLVVFREAIFHGAYLSAGIGMIAVAVGLLALCVTMGVGMLRQWRPLTALLGRLRRLRPQGRFLARLQVRCARTEAQVSRVFREERGRAAEAFVLLFLSHAAIFLKPAAFFALGAWAGLGFGELSLVFVASQAINALQVTPSGVGTLDGGLIGTFALLGLAEPTAMAFLLCLRLWDATTVGAGAFFAARAGAGLLSNDAEPAVFSES